MRVSRTGVLSARISAGVYNEEVFASLDWVLAEAANRNLRIILPIEVRSPHTPAAVLL